VATSAIIKRVRESARQVLERAEFVRLDQNQLADCAASLQPAEVKARYYFEEDFHFKSDGRVLLDYVFTLAAVNFGSGFSPQWKAHRRGQSTYKSMAATFKTYAEENHSLNATFAARVQSQELAGLFGVPPEMPLMEMFAKSLNQLGWLVEDEYDGEYANLLDSLEGPEVAANLVQLLTSQLSYFDDRAIYRGEPVYFYKRAQILANDLYLAFNGVGFGDIPDIANLTSFADNLVPHFFRVEQVLEYEAGLAERIESGELLTSGSPEEVEIRAAGVYCVEEVCRLLNERSTGPAEQIFPAQLDVYLWNKAQTPRYKSRPRHLTTTYFY